MGPSGVHTKMCSGKKSIGVCEVNNASENRIYLVSLSYLDTLSFSVCISNQCLFSSSFLL